MKCPILKVDYRDDENMHRTEIISCLKEECAWWNDRFGMCSQAVDAYLKGQEDYHREIKSNREGG